MTLDKRLRADQPNPFNVLGQSLIFEFEVTNSGNITLTAPVEIDDPLITDAGGLITCAPGPIAPGASILCEGSYAVTQADLDAGTLSNVATASISQPVVPLQPGDPSQVTVTTPQDDVSVTGEQLPVLEIQKRILASSATTYAAPGDVVRFEYIVTNAGNVTLTEPITISDDKIGNDLPCSTGVLAPGAQVSCSHDWVAQQADIDAGSVTNTAIANGIYAGTAVISGPETATANAVQDSSLAVVKNLDSATPDLFDEGTVLAYSFDVTNDGNTTIQGPITIDDSLTTATCPAVSATGLVPGDSLTCTASYTLTAGDLALGSTTNVASALGSFDGGVITSPTDSVVYPVDASPALVLAKDSVPSDVTFDTLGQEITYTYTVTNQGGAGFAGDVSITDDKLDAPFVCHAATDGVLNVGESATCTATYLVTQADLDAEQVTNEAVASTIFAPGTDDEVTVISPSATKTVPGVAAPEIVLEKLISDGPDPAALDDVLTYTLTATNAGNQTLGGVVIDDPRIAELTCEVDGATAPDDVSLLPGQSLICSGTYTVTQADIDAQELENTASVRTADPQGDPITGEDTITHPLQDATPALSLAKIVLPDPGTGAGFALPGDLVEFAVTVTNEGNVTLTTVDVTDDLVPGTCSIGPIAPGASDSSCRFTYAVTQDDVDAVNGSSPSYGGFTNTVTGVGQPANPDATPITGTGDVFVRGPDHVPSFALTKLADFETVSAAGEIVTYTYTVTNSGNITLTDQPQITDDKIGTFACGTMPVGGLAPGGVVSCTATYVITQADMDAGSVTNIATVASPEVPLPSDPGNARATETVETLRAPSLSLSKTPSIAADAQVDDVITYTYEVENTGNVTVTDVTVADAHTSAAGTQNLTIGGDVLHADTGVVGTSTDAATDGVWDVLAPGDIVRFTAQYTVTQADVDAGDELSNTATVTATDPEDTGLPLVSTLVEVPVVAPAPSIEAIKTVDLSALSTPPVAGEVLQFQITLSNTGNVSLNNVTLTDTFRRTDGTVLALDDGPTYQAGDAGVTGRLDVGETWTYSASYALDQADVDAGGVTNSVLAQAVDPSGTPVRDVSDDGLPGGQDDPTVVQVPAQPGIEGEKTIIGGTAELGQTIVFQITATNTGNVTLTDVGATDDGLRRADGTVLALTSAPGFVSADQGSGAGTLLPGETAIYTATYVLVQADIDAGGVSNVATVSGRPPLGAPVTDVTDNGVDGDGNSVDDPVVLDVPAQPAISLLKRLHADSMLSFAAVGDVIDYEFEVTNTGNITVTDAISIADPLITDAGGIITCEAPPLAPGENLLCAGSYVITQADIDAGQLDNTATASAGDVTSDPSDLSVPAIQTPDLSVLKEAEEIATVDFITGAVVNYSYTVTNSGNTTVTAPISVTDNLIADVTCPALPATGLAPAATLVCTGAYTVTADDVDLGSVTNLASATDGVVTSGLTSETVPAEGIPALTLSKAADAGASFAEVGDLIPYTFTVENTGTRAFAAPITVYDDQLGEISCFAPSDADPDFIAGEVATCTGTHIVTQADLDAGEVINDAYAQTTYGVEDTVVTSPSVTETVDATLQPELTIEKDSTPNPVSTVGETVTYTLVATNTGNQTLSSVVVRDPMLPGLSCQTDTLPRDQSLTCIGTYVVTQADVDAGQLVNVATGQSVTPQGTPVVGDAREVTVMPTPAPAISLTKSASPNPFGPVGSVLTYQMSVVNTGNVTLTDIVVRDAMDPDFRCLISSLAPSASDQTCRFTTEVTQDQLDAGMISNTATVRASDPFETVVRDRDTLVTDGPAHVPGLEVTKTALPSATAVGAPVTYLLTVVNTGNVTLDLQAPVDVMQRLNGEATALDAPFALQSGDQDGDGRLDVDEVWTYRGVHTLTQRDLNVGGLSNSVTLGGSGPDGTPVSDVSDNGIDSDGNTTDDPTIVILTQAPELTVTKSVSSLTGQRAGDQVVFLIEAFNSGNVDLSDLQVSADQLTRADNSVIGQGTAVPVNVPAALVPGDTASWSVTHTLTQADIDAGGIANTATVRGTAPSGDQVSDVSADDDPLDGNVTDDVTELPIAPMPGLQVLKVADEIGAVAGETVRFVITAENTGNVTLSNVALTDNLSNLDGDAIGPVTVAFLGADGTPPSGQGALQPGETASYSASYVLTQTDIDSGGIENTATVTTTSPLGVLVSDVSDDDAVGDSDPTRVTITPTPSFEVVKTAQQGTPLFPTVQVVTFTLQVTNTGNVTQDAIQVSDDLSVFVAPAVLLHETYPVVVRASGFADGTANAAYDGVTVADLLSGNAALAPGETGSIEIDVTYHTGTGQPAGENTGYVSSGQLDTPTPSNPVGVASTDSDGDSVSDVLEGTGSDRDGDGVVDAFDYDPTGYFYCEDDGRILSGGRISVSGPAGRQSGLGTSNNITIVQDGSAGYFQFFVDAPGSYTLEISYPPNGAPSTTRLSRGLLDVTTRLPENPASLGSSEFGSTGSLADNSAGANPFYLRFDIAAGDPQVLNNNIPLTDCQGLPDVSATKTADRNSAVVGESINFTLSFENNTGVNYSDATLIDLLPAGLVYTPGSAVVNGVQTDPVVTARRRLSWPGRDMSPNTTTTVTFAARVSSQAGFGPLTNQTWFEDAGGARRSNIATATVRIEPEHVFDCSDVIGKVFDDRNRNGYQDGPDGRPVPIIDEDAMFDSKLGKLAPATPAEKTGEPGLPGVRLSTVNGLLITTDQYGRFHVPCAALPDDTGSNFTLKLDTRTLPSGYRVTTENPRVVRLTAGKVAKMNFGAALSNVVDIDLTASAFVANKAQPKPALGGAIDGLLAQIRSKPSTLRLSYLLKPGESRELATARMRALEKMIRARWRGKGRYRLLIEKTVKRVQ